MSDDNSTLASRSDETTSPVVSVVIVNWNKSELTLKCLASIVEHTRSFPYEIIIVDNGSAKGEIAALERGCACAGARLIPLNQNLFFGDANNIGAEASRAKYVLFMNNDVTVTPGCLDALLLTLQTAFRAGAVGPRFVYADGRLQEAGAYIRADGWSVQHGKSENPNALIAGPGRHIVDYCSAACLLVIREVFLRVGGFDSLFEPAYFEDADLCLRLRSIGLFTYFCGDATVIHEENVTSSVIWTPEQLLAVSVKSHSKFAARWGDYLKARMDAVVKLPLATQVNWQPEPDLQGDQTIVWLRGTGVINDSPMWNAILRFAAQLDKTFYTVFLAEEACSRCRIYSLCSRLHIELHSFSVRRISEVILSAKNRLISFENRGGAWQASDSAPRLSSAMGRRPADADQRSGN